MCMYVTLQLGLFVEGAGTLALKLTARSQDQDIEKSSTQMDREEVRKARKSATKFDHDRECGTCASLALLHINEVVQVASWDLLHGLGCET